MATEFRRGLGVIMIEGCLLWVELLAVSSARGSANEILVQPLNQPELISLIFANKQGLLTPTAMPSELCGKLSKEAKVDLKNRL